MIIETIEISKLHVPFHSPFKVTLGEITSAENVIVKIMTCNGIVGWGEASPFSPITGDSPESCYCAAQVFARHILGKDPREVERRMHEIHALTVGEPSARSAFDMALFDIAAKAAGVPLYKYLGGQNRKLRTDITIGWQESVEKTVERASEIVEAGFDAIKLKVGRSFLEDVEHVAAIRAKFGDTVKIKVDSNQGWDYAEAVANIKAMKPYQLDYVEQPLPVWDYANMSRLRANVDFPICADESVFDDKDALKLVASGAVDYLNIKLGKSGGICTGLRINAIAEASGSKCMIGCFSESRLGLSAAAHLAIARPNIEFIDLDSAFSFCEDPVIGGISYDETIGGLISLTDEPGLGAEIKEGYLDPADTIRIS